MFWGIIALVLGGIIAYVILILGAIIEIGGLGAFIYGLYLFRNDYRLRVKGVVTTAPPPPQPQGTMYCPKCGQQATFIPQYNRYYCYRDKEYVG